MENKHIVPEFRVWELYVPTQGLETRAYSAGGGLGFGLNIVTTSGLHPGGEGQQPEPHVQRFWFNPTLT